MFIYFFCYDDSTNTKVMLQQHPIFFTKKKTKKTPKQYTRVYTNSVITKHLNKIQTAVCEVSHVEGKSYSSTHDADYVYQSFMAIRQKLWK